MQKSEAVSKVIIPREHYLDGYDDRYLFVDFPDAEEAELAREATDGEIAWGVQVRVTHARSPDSAKVDERQGWRDRQELYRLGQAESKCKLSLKVINIIFEGCREIKLINSIRAGHPQS